MRIDRGILLFLVPLQHPQQEHRRRAPGVAEAVRKRTLVELPVLPALVGGIVPFPERRCTLVQHTAPDLLDELARVRAASALQEGHRLIGVGVGRTDGRQVVGGERAADGLELLAFGDAKVGGVDVRVTREVSGLRVADVKAEESPLGIPRLLVQSLLHLLGALLPTVGVLPLALDARELNAGLQRTVVDDVQCRRRLGVRRPVNEEPDLKTRWR